MQAHGAHGGGAGLPFLGGAAQARVGGAEPASEGVLGGVEKRGLGLHPEEILEVGGLGHPPGAGAEVERQPFDLAARHASLSRQAGDEDVQGLRFDPDLVRGQGLTGQARQVARLVLVAGDDDAAGGLLPHLADLGIPPQGAGLDQEEGLGIELARRVGGQGFGRRAVDGDLVSGETQAHQPPPAHHRDRLQLALQLARRAIHIGLGEQGAVEGVIRPRRHHLGQGLGALAHHADVATIDHGDTDGRIRRLQEALDVGTAAQDHPAVPPRSRWLWTESVQSQEA